MEEKKKKKAANPVMRRKIIIRWRQKKGLCEECGMNPHTTPCVENYEKSDMRDKNKTIPTDLRQKEFAGMVSVNYLVIDMTPTRHGQTFKSCFIQFLKRSFPNHAIFLVGDVSDYGAYFIKQIQKTAGITLDVTDAGHAKTTQYIQYAKRFYTLSLTHVEYALTNKVPTTLFINKGVRLNKVQLMADVCVINRNEEVGMQVIPLFGDKILKLEQN